MLRTVLVLLVLLWLPGRASADEKAASFAGMWRFDWGVSAGRAVPTHDIHWFIGGDHQVRLLHGAQPQPYNEKFQLKFDSERGAVDHVQDGRTKPGIYEVREDGRLLVLCFNFGDDERPKTIDSMSSHTIYHLKRAETSVPYALADDVGLDLAKLVAIDKALGQYIKANEISGAVALVVKDGQIAYHQTIGASNLQFYTPMRQDSLFAVASMTKPVTGVAVMMLVDEGKLSLDDPVSKYIPEFKSATLETGAAPQREITIRDVVTHTSGLSGDQQLMGTLQETARKLAARPLEFEPGTKWMYSPGMTVAGACVEIAAAQPFEEFLQERIFEPLGMTNTTFNPTKDQQTRIVKLHKKEGDKLVETSHWINDFSQRRAPNPSAGLFSTGLDMAAFYAMVLGGGELNGKRILSKKACRELTTIHSGATTTGFTPGNGWGVGWCVVREPQGVTAMLSKGSAGHGGAFGTQGWIDPEKNMAFVLMIQRSGLPNSDASQMRQDLQQIAVDAIK